MKRYPAIPHFCLWGVLFLYVEVEAFSSDLMRDSALSWHGELPCGNWACECTFKRQTGCCCVAKRFHQLEEETFKNMVEIWESITHLKNDINTVISGMKVAFTAMMRSPVYPERCFGPFTRNVPIPYSIISLNDGNAYNPSLGAFTAQCAGLYSFTFTAYSNVETAGLRLYHMVQLMKNGEALTGLWEDNREDAEDSATQTVLLELQTGDQVYVELLSGRYICNDYNQRNSFSGYLLYLF